MALDRSEVRDLYRARAPRYDFTANLYYLAGFRETACRRRAVAALRLRPGATVVELGCGTGLNFRFLQQAVGPSGRIIGVDLTDAMLARARERVVRHGWRNVELVERDAAAYRFPEGIDGVVSTFALTLVPEYEEVIARASRALAPGGRLVVADLKRPEAWPLWLVKLAVRLTRPFAVSLDLATRKPWEAMKRHLADVAVTELYGGFAYVAVGEKPAVGAEA